MEDFRSKSYGDGRMQIETYTANASSGGMQDLRCYSASYASSVPSSMSQNQSGGAHELKFKKGKSTNSSSSKNWSFGGAEGRAESILSFEGGSAAV